jgi:hypothetical protein
MKKNKFGDPIFPRHKMARMIAKPGEPHSPSGMTLEAAAEYAPGHDPDREPLWKIECPMSGQPE